MKQIKTTICTALTKCGYKESIEELMLFADFKSATGERLAWSSTTTPYNKLDESKFIDALVKFCEQHGCTWGKIWLNDESFFIFGETDSDWQHIDCHVPEELDPKGLFLG